MPNPRKFIVLDLNPEGLDILSRTLRRRFPEATVTTSATLEDALTINACEKVDAIVVHRPVGQTGEEAVRQFRKASATVPIVLISSTDRRASAIASGANAFLLYDQWQMLGGVLDDLIQEGAKRSRLA